MERAWEPALAVLVEPPAPLRNISSVNPNNGPPRHRGSKIIDIAEVGHQVGRPRIAGMPDRLQSFARADKPPLARHVADRCRGIAVHNHLDVVDRPVGSAVRAQTMLVRLRMSAGVPSLYRQIDAARERKPVVDDDDLLMVCGVKRMVLIQLHGDSRMRLPVRAEQERHRIAGRMHHSTAPHQDANVKLRPPFDQPMKKPPERAAIAHVGT
jgi:hypothetical protein